MTMDRRSFLGVILAAAVAPAVVRAESIMRVRPIILPGDDEFRLFTGEIGRLEGMTFHGPELRDYGSIAVMSAETADGRRFGVQMPNKLFAHSVQYPEMIDLMRENLIEQVLRG